TSATSGSGPGGKITVGVGGKLTLGSSASTVPSHITAESSGSGDAGAINVSAQSLSLAGSVVASNANCSATSGCGNAGIVNVTASGDIVLDSAGISAFSSGSGQAGSVSAAGLNISLRAGSYIASGAVCTAGAGCGNGGTVTVTATGDIVLDGS